MRKVLGFVFAGFAVLALSGCNPVTGTTGNTYSKVDILKLKEGYHIQGYDDTNEKYMDFYFCGKNYQYYKGETEYQGTFNIKDSDNYENARINFFDSRPNVSYRIDTDDSGDAGYIEVGRTYRIKFNHEYIRVQAIEKDSTCNSY